MNKSYCYDCGRSHFTYEPGIDAEVCDHCAEVVYLSERVGPLKALARRLLFRWHSNTQDSLAAGWRR